MDIPQFNSDANNLANNLLLTAAKNKETLGAAISEFWHLGMRKGQLSMR